MSTEFYYRFYMVATVSQVIVSGWNLGILYKAHREASKVALASIFILALNTLDASIIYRMIYLGFEPSQDQTLLQLFWFGFRNIATFAYWYVAIMHYRRLKRWYHVRQRQRLSHWTR